MARYEEIRDDLFAKIQDGTYPEGSLIPSEMELASAYGVSRPTVHQAIRLLADAGYLESRRRRGTIVTRPKIDQSFTMGIRSFQDQAGMAGHEVTTAVLVFRREEAEAQVAEALELEPGEEAYKLVRLRSVDGTPNVFVESYIPCRLYPGLDDFDLSCERLYEAMGKVGEPVVRAHRKLEVTSADETEAALLDVAPHDPLFLFHSVGRDARGRACEYSIATYRGKDNVFEFEVGD